MNRKVRYPRWYARPVSGVGDSSRSTNKLSPTKIKVSNLRSEVIGQADGNSDHLKVLLNPDLTSLDPLELTAEPFQFVPSQFLDNARYNRPHLPTATVSGFSGWVHSIYALQSEVDILLRGRLKESGIFIKRRKLLSANPQFWEGVGSDWELIHNGLNINTEHERHSSLFEISELNIHDEVLRASPDLMYRHRLSGEMFVVEIKFSQAAIPENLWPDIWAQLWAYSRIPVCAAAPKLTVIGEVWGENTLLNSRNVSEYEMDQFGHEEIYLRRIVRRDPRKDSFGRFFQALFDIYAGRHQS